MRKLAALVTVVMIATPLAGADARSGPHGSHLATRDASSAQTGPSRSWSGRAGGTTRVLADFDDNGKDDLAVGVPAEDVGGDDSAGAVQVFYGTPSGLDTESSEILTQDAANALGGSEPDDQFGASLASGDFDDDGFPDLAVGSPGETTAAEPGAGGITIFFGSAVGLSLTGTQSVTQDHLIASDASDGSQHRDNFGFALAAGKFDQGSTFDLAIGLPGEEPLSAGSDADFGEVVVVYGGSSGLDMDKADRLTQDGLAEGRPETGDNFGTTLAAANLGRNSQWDLAVGIPNEMVNSRESAGAVQVFYGVNTNLDETTVNGVSPLGDQLWTQESVGIADNSEDFDLFGTSLALANLGRTTHADVVVGAPGDGPPRADLGGMVHVLFGARSGVTSKGSRIFTQDTAGVPDKTELIDVFGFSVAAGDLNGDGRADIVIGARGENLGSGATTNINAGQVTVIYSNDSGLTGAGSTVWNQATSGIADSPQSNDFFGSALAVGDYGKNAADDLAIGVPNETLNDAAADPLTRAGAVHVLYGSAGGITATGEQFLTQDCDGCPDQAEDQDGFGSPLN